MANGRYDQTPDERRRLDWRDDRDDRQRAVGGRFRDEDQGYGRREDYGREAGGRDWGRDWGRDRAAGEGRREWDPGNYGDLERGYERGGYGGDQRGRDRGGQGDWGRGDWGQSGGRSEWGRNEQQGSGFEGGYSGYPSGQGPYRRPGGQGWSSGDMGQGFGSGGGAYGGSGQPGQSHRGKGPKGYTRPDDRIREDVNDRLADDDMLDASDIAVTVSGGEVTLEGQVDSRQAKRQAEDCVENCSGVKHVQNNLRVRDRSGDQSSGATGGQGAGKVKSKDL